VVHKVGADDLVAIEDARELELRADTVRRRDEDPARAGRGEEPAELADVADDLGTPGSMRSFTRESASSARAMFTPASR